ncbi:MAG: ion transporter [Steroidobacteraceae bacterium]|nr:ion transporter [Steroidobacteraceae bacterium]MDW8258326.1 ion transporter [Gammaproteobacteria bacterium]
MNVSPNLTKHHRPSMDTLTPPAPHWRERLREFVDAERTQRLIIGLIVVNAITLGLETFPSAMRAYGELLHSLDAALLGVFVVELLLKMIAHGWRFFRSGWNWFDLIVVGIALLPATGGLSVLRALRVLRVLRLVSAAPKMRFVVESLARSLPGLGSIGLLLMIFFYVFAVLATNLFGRDFPQWFGSLFGSMFSLFQIMTLEGWVDIAREVMARYPLAWLYFLAFIALATITVLNLVIAVIVNAMQDPAAPVQHEKVASAAELEALRAEIAALRALLEARRDQR